MAAPRIAILLPVYNAAATLAEALDSLQAQTFSDFEILALDDGSTDATGDILRRYAAHDPRLHIHRHANMGITRTLNRGLDLAGAAPTFIGRMDGDDIALPHRLATQVAFFAAHPEIALCGAWDQNFGGARTDINRLPHEPGHVKAALLFRNPLSHPTVLWRRAALADRNLRYDPDCLHIEDYDIFARVARQVPIANIPEVLSRKRWTPTSINATWRAVQVQQIGLLQRRILAWLDLHPTAEQERIHHALAWDALESSESFLRAAHEWLLTIRAANRQTRAFDEAGLMRTLTGRWIAVAGLAARCCPQLYAQIQEAPFRTHVAPGLLPPVTTHLETP